MRTQRQLYGNPDRDTKVTLITPKSLILRSSTRHLQSILGLEPLPNKILQDFRG